MLISFYHQTRINRIYLFLSNRSFYNKIKNKLYGQLIQLTVYIIICSKNVSVKIGNKENPVNQIYSEENFLKDQEYNKGLKFAICF